MQHEFINSDNALAELCRSLQDCAWIALDTEFLRERTYYARLCLIQLGTPDLVACIDPLALERLDPLHALLAATAQRKVLHAARQDLEVFRDLDAGAGRHVVPAPVFDTQIGAAYLGFDEQIGYANLVTALLGVTLDKAHTRTDWSVRPLSAAQVQYAEDDVRYLVPVYETIRDRLIAAGRLAWVEEDCARLTDPGLYAADPAEAWRRLRGGADLPAVNQQILRALAVFREQTAQRRNLPRGWVLRDEVLFELARTAPQTSNDLVAIRGLEDGARKSWGEGILASIEQGRRAEPVTLWERQPPPTPEQTTLSKRLMETVRTVAREQQMAPGVLATRRDIEKLVRGADPTNVLRGWRAEMLGPKLDILLSS